MALDRRGVTLGEVLPDTSKGLLRLPEDDWLHYSRRGSRVKVRAVGEEVVAEAKGFDVSDSDQRDELLGRIRGGRFYSGWPLKGAPEGRVRLSRRRSPIPQTQLRSLYQVLRDFDDSVVGPALLENAIRKRGKKLIDYFEASYWHFDQYGNHKEGFGDGANRRQKGAFKFAERLARELEAGGRWGEDPTLGFDFVAREVDFRRTSGGVFFEDGTSGRCSGGGGADLFLRARDGGLPIIGEIKASTDTNVFVALVQALTYACELVTPAQLERVERHFGKHFPAGHLSRSEGPHADLYLICEGQPALSEETHTLAGHLLSRRNHLLGQHIRKIVCLQAPTKRGILVAMTRSRVRRFQSRLRHQPSSGSLVPGPNPTRRSKGQALNRCTVELSLAGGVARESRTAQSNLW